MAENVRKENVQNALKDLQKYLDDLYYSDEDLNEEEYEFLQNALENLATKEDDIEIFKSFSSFCRSPLHRYLFYGMQVPIPHPSFCNDIQTLLVLQVHVI